MIKKILLLALCLSWIPAMAAAPTTFDFNMIHGQAGSFHMRSITLRDKEDFGFLLENLKTDSTNPSGIGVTAVDAHTSRREKENNPYHAMVFQVPGESLFPVIIQGRMPVFGAAAGKGYDPVDHAAIIAKWKSLGVRQTVGDGADAHDERVGNYGLLNFVPLIPLDVDGDARREIYTGMIDLAKALRAQGKLMTLENNDKLEFTDAALPNHVIMLLNPGFRDLGLLESMGWSVDRNPEFEKFYNAPRVVVTYDLTH